MNLNVLYNANTWRMALSEFVSVFTSQITTNFPLQDQSFYGNSQYFLSESAKHINTFCGMVQFLNFDLYVTYLWTVSDIQFIFFYDIFVSCNCVVTRWQCLLYMSANMKMIRTNMKMVNTKSKVVNTKLKMVNTKLFLWTANSSTKGMYVKDGEKSERGDHRKNKISTDIYA